MFTSFLQFLLIFVSFWSFNVPRSEVYIPLTHDRLNRSEMKGSLLFMEQVSSSVHLTDYLFSSSDVNKKRLSHKKCADSPYWKFSAIRFDGFMLQIPAQVRRISYNMKSTPKKYCSHPDLNRHSISSNASGLQMLRSCLNETEWMS